MINNTAIDVAIGLFFIYALYSLLTTTLTELIASLFNQRGQVLKMGLKRMLENDKPKKSNANSNHVSEQKESPDNNASKEAVKHLPENLSLLFFDKPEIKYLTAKTLGFTRFPSYLKPKTFVNSLLDTLGFDYSKSTNLDSIRKQLDPNNETHKMLIILIDRADNNVNQFKILVEEWFNETMDRVSGWYKRYNQVITFFVGALIAYSLNINTIEISKILSDDKETRIAMVEAASDYMASVKVSSDSLADNKSFEELNEDVKTLIQETKNVKSIMDLPRPKLGSAENEVSWPIYIFGCLITTIALSLGSPFWFDLLSKLIKLRSTGTQEKTTNTTSTSKPPVG
jgi:hypothetical protein